MRTPTPRNLKILRWTPTAGYLLATLAFGTPAVMIPAYLTAVVASITNLAVGALLTKTHPDRKKTTRTGIMAILFGVASAQFVVYGLHFG
jgi:hypothetical protein